MNGEKQKKKFSGWRGEKKYFIRLFISCLLIIAIPVCIMGTIWYYMVKSGEEQKALVREENHMELVSQEVENLLYEIEQDIIGLEYGAIYKNYRLDKSPVNTLHMLDELSKIGRMNEAVHSVYFYDRSEDRLYNGDGSYSIEEFYDTGWLSALSEDNVTQRLPVRNILDEDFSEVVKKNGWESVYPDAQVLTIVSDGSKSSYFVVNVDINALITQLIRKFVSDERESFLVDGGGKVLVQAGTSQSAGISQISVEWLSTDELTASWEKDGATMLARQLGYENLYYVERLPHALLAGSSESYKVLIPALILLISLCMFVISAFVARKLYRPIGELYQEMGSQSTHKISSEDEIAAITRTFREMNRYQEDSLQENARQKGMIQAETLRMRLSRMITQEDFQRENPGLFPAEGGGLYAFLVCRIDFGKESQNGDQMRECLKEVLNTYLTAKSGGIFTECQYGIYAALFVVKNGGNVAGVLQQAIVNLVDGKVYLAVSPCFGPEEDMVEIFRKTDILVREKQFVQDNTDREIQPWRDIPITNYEAALIRGILLGNRESVEEQIEKLKRDLCQYGHAGKVTDVCQRILLTVDRECRIRSENGGVTEVASQIRDCGRFQDRGLRTLEDILNVMEETFLAECRKVTGNAGNENTYYRDACTYIQEHYAENMSVSDVADHLGISYAYLSKIFKSQSEGGEKLLDYLNRIRIGKAKELLCQTDLPLSEIAEKVGYNNTQSLQRFFKKYEAQTPGDYRKMYQKKDS